VDRSFPTEFPCLGNSHPFLEKVHLFAPGPSWLPPGRPNGFHPSEVSNCPSLPRMPSCTCFLLTASPVPIDESFLSNKDCKIEWMKSRFPFFLQSLSHFLPFPPVGPFSHNCRVLIGCGRALGFHPWTTFCPLLEGPVSFPGDPRLTLVVSVDFRHRLRSPNSGEGGRFSVSSFFFALATD